MKKIWYFLPLVFCGCLDGDFSSLKNGDGRLGGPVICPDPASNPRAYTKPEEKFDPKEWEGLTGDILISLVIDTHCFLERDPSEDAFLLRLLRQDLKWENISWISPSWSFALEVPALTSSKIRRYLNEDVCIITASPAEAVELHVTNDPLINEQKHLDAIRFYDYYGALASATFQVPEVLVAITDDGFDMDHPDLQASYYQNQRELNGSPDVDDDGNGFIDDVSGWNFAENINDASPRPNDTSGHGSHVMGFISAQNDNNEGIASTAGDFVKVLPLNVFPYARTPFSTEATMVALENAIRYAADNKAEVISISLGVNGTRQSLKDALAYAISKNVFIAVSAGNDASDLNTRPKSPAIYGKDFEGMMTVGALDSQFNEGIYTLCSFSNTNPSFVEIAAPGCHSGGGLLSTVHEGVDESLYDYKAGTSMSTPMVSAAAALSIALYKQQNGRSPSNDWVESFLKEQANKQINLYDDILEGNILDMISLWVALIGTDPGPSDPSPCL